MKGKEGEKLWSKLCLCGLRRVRGVRYPEELVSFPNLFKDEEADERGRSGLGLLFPKAYFAKGKKAAGNERFRGRDLKRLGNCKSLAMQIKPNKFKESGNFVYFA